MHILEQYALGCGVKIKRPYIYNKYYPLPFEKYIILHAPNKFQSRTYDYWPDVLDFLRPYLIENDIKIIQIGDKSETLFTQDCYITNGQTDFNQLSYLIKHAKLLLGIDSFPIHLAGYHNINIVGLYSNMYKEHSMPYWGDKDKQILIESHRNGMKPSYTQHEIIKTINLINPEDIANRVLDLLNIKSNLKLKSLFVGGHYKNQIVEMIPSHPVNVANLNIPHINIRMDKQFNLEVLQHQLNISKVAIITNKALPIDLLKFYKENIIRITFFISPNFDHTFFEEFVKLGIQFDLASEEDDVQLNKLKIKYMEFGNIIKISHQDLPKEVRSLKNLKFKSNKKTFYNNKVYPTHDHALKDKPYDNADFFEFSDSISKEDVSFIRIFE